MQLILFSKDESVLAYLLEKVKKVHYSGSIVTCKTFAELGQAVETQPEHILVYSLHEGNEAENICYQFIAKYQRPQQMLILAKKPSPQQGMRAFHAGAHGYSNLYLHNDKFKVALEVIQAGRIWIGAQTLNVLIKDCLLRKNNAQKTTDEPVGNIAANNKGQPKGLWAKLVHHLSSWLFSNKKQS